MSEKTIQSKIMLAASQTGATVFRNNTGVALAITPPYGGSWSKLLQTVISFVKKMGGSASPIKYGLTEGSSDLIGWRTITVTPDMVGKPAALFLALEVKTATGKPTAEQINFIAAVRSAGGYAGIVRSVDEAIAICNPLVSL